MRRKDVPAVARMVKQLNGPGKPNIFFMRRHRFGPAKSTHGCVAAVRSKLIGRALAARADSDCQKRGCKWFRASANPKNKRAQRLYRDLGFIRRSYRPVFYMMKGNVPRKFAKQKDATIIAS